MLCDGKLYCDLIDTDTHEVLDSVVVKEGQDIVFRRMPRDVTVAVQFRWSPLLATGPQRLTPDDQFLINDGAEPVELLCFFTPSIA